MECCFAPITVAVSKFIKPIVVIILITQKLWQDVTHYEAIACYKLIIQIFPLQRGLYVALPREMLRSELRTCGTFSMNSAVE